MGLDIRDTPPKKSRGFRWSASSFDEQSYQKRQLAMIKQARPDAIMIQGPFNDASGKGTKRNGKETYQRHTRVRGAASMVDSETDGTGITLLVLIC